MLGLGVLSLALMTVDYRFDYLSQVRYYASFATTPLHRAAILPRDTVAFLNSSLQNIDSLRIENDQLKREIMLQRSQLQKLDHLNAENQRLNELLNASSEVGESVAWARLIGESPDPFTKRVLINKGDRDGVYVGQPVLDAYGLMGQVVTVGPNSSWVLLVSDAQHATPVQINRNGNRAIAAGSSGSQHGLVLNNLPHTFDIEEGDALVTSGLGRRFPAGYPVGVVNSVRHDPSENFAFVTALPAAHMDQSRDVLLVFAGSEAE